MIQSLLILQILLVIYLYFYSIIFITHFVNIEQYPLLQYVVMSIWSSISDMLWFLSRYLINLIMIKFIHKSRSYQNHNPQFTCVWPIRINTLRYYFLFSQLPFIYLTYNSEFSVPTSDSVHTGHKQYRVFTWWPKSHIYVCLSTRPAYTIQRIPAQSQLAFPNLGGKPSSLVMPSSVCSCTVTPINTDFLSN